MSRRSRILFAIGGVGISGLALAFLFSTLDVGAAIDVLLGASPLPLVAGLGLLAGEIVLRSIRWAVLLGMSTSHGRVSPLRLLPVLLVGYLGNAVLPARLGEPLRAVIVSRREGVGVAEALASVLLERIVDVAVLAVVALVATAFLPPMGSITQVVAIAAGIGIVILLVLVTVGIGPLATIGRRAEAVRRSTRLSAALAHVERFAHALGGSHRRPTILAAAGISSVAWLLDGAIFWFFGLALGLELPYAGALLIAGITVLSTAVPSAPGFIGTFELAGVAAATAIGVPPESALALAVLAHAATLGPLAIGGAISIPFIGGGLRDALRSAGSPAAR